MVGIWGSIREKTAIDNLQSALQPLIGHEIKYLKIPVEAAAGFEPSQIGTIIGTLTDAILPHIAETLGLGLSKNPTTIGSREGYPDFLHTSGYRIELKGLFKDNPNVILKRPPTPREASARLTQKVTVNNVLGDDDALLILVYQLEPTQEDPGLLSPVIKNLKIFPVIECVNARDHRLTTRGGRWFGNYETPTVLSKAAKQKLKIANALNIEKYGRKESEGHDYNEDTNFGKLKRIPYKELQTFLMEQGSAFAATGTYPELWRIGNAANLPLELAAELEDDLD